jgi:hypothetical protein
LVPARGLGIGLWAFYCVLKVHQVLLLAAVVPAPLSARACHT